MADASLNKSTFEEVEIIKDANGLMAKISRRTRTGNLTFAIFKTFQRDGQEEQTSFIELERAEQLKTMVDTVIARCKVLETTLPPVANQNKNGRGGRR